MTVLIKVVKSKTSDVAQPCQSPSPPRVRSGNEIICYRYTLLAYLRGWLLSAEWRDVIFVTKPLTNGKVETSKLIPFN